MNTLITLLLGLLLPPTPDALRVQVQWSLAHAPGFVMVDNWDDTAKKPDPSDVYYPIDDSPGWVAAITIGNHLICCCDHYAIEQSADSVKSYCWRTWYRYTDAPSAQVCKFSATAFSCDYYGAKRAHPWADFKPPDDRITRHGKMLPIGLWREHTALWHGYNELSF